MLLNLIIGAAFVGVGLFMQGLGIQHPAAYMFAGGVFGVMITGAHND